jgi:hypothetical protein
VVDFQKYRQLMEQGGSPQRIYFAMKADGVDAISCIKTLRQLLDISVREAKEIMTEADTGQTLLEFQSSLLPALRQALALEQHDQVFGIIRFLETLREKPGMYIGSDVRALQHYLNGLATGCALCGVSQDTADKDWRAVLRQIVTERGWSWSEKHIVNTMYELGYPYQAIVNEAIAIEIEVWKRLFDIEIT